MTARDLLLQQFGIVYYMVARNVEGMTHEGSLARAAGGGNTANWIIGHLVSVHNAIMGLAAWRGRRPAPAAEWRRPRICRGPRDELPGVSRQASGQPSGRQFESRNSEMPVERECVRHAVAAHRLEAHGIGE